jgi:hypothetical protein
MMLKVHRPNLIYLEGRKNIVTDALSRLDLLPDMEEAQLVECLAFTADDDLQHSNAFPISSRLLQTAQSQDKSLLKKAMSHKKHVLQTVHGGGKWFELISLKNKIVAPSYLQTRVVDWCHNTLFYPCENHMEEAAWQHFTWRTRLKEDVHRACKKCHTCQMTKRQNQMWTNAG